MEALRDIVGRLVTRAALAGGLDTAAVPGRTVAQEISDVSVLADGGIRKRLKENEGRISGGIPGEIENGEFAIDRKGKIVPGSCSFFRRGECLSIYDLISAPSSATELPILPPVDAAEPPFTSRASGVRHILAMSRNSQIIPAIIKTIIVSMIDEHRSRHFQQEAMKEHGSMLAVRQHDRARCIKKFFLAVPDNLHVPLESKNALRILVIDHGDISACQRNFDSHAAPIEEKEPRLAGEPTSREVGATEAALGRNERSSVGLATDPRTPDGRDRCGSITALPQAESRNKRPDAREASNAAISDWESVIAATPNGRDNPDLAT